MEALLQSGSSGEHNCSKYTRALQDNDVCMFPSAGLDNAGAFFQRSGTTGNFGNASSLNTKFSPLRIIDPALLYNLLDTSIVFSLILREQTSCLRICWGVGIWVRQEGLDGRQNGCNIVDRTPLVLQNVKADAAICIDVRMEHFCDEAHCGRLAWVVFCELKCQLEGSSFPGRIIGPEDDGAPKHDVVVLRRSLDPCRWVCL